MRIFLQKSELFIYGLLVYLVTLTMVQLFMSAGILLIGTPLPEHILDVECLRNDGIPIPD